MVDRFLVFLLTTFILSVTILTLGLYLAVNTCGYKTVYESQCITVWSTKHTIYQDDICLASIWCEQESQNNTYPNITLFRCDNTYPDCWNRWSYYIANPNRWTGYSYSRNTQPGVQELSLKELVDYPLCIVGVLPLPFAVTAILFFIFYIRAYYCNCLDRDQCCQQSSSCWTFFRNKSADAHPLTPAGVSHSQYGNITYT